MESDKNFVQHGKKVFQNLLVRAGGTRAGTLHHLPEVNRFRLLLAFKELLEFSKVAVQDLFRFFFYKTLRKLEESAGFGLHIHR